MVRSYLKIAFRNIKRNKGCSAINILGLGLGMAVCMLIVIWVQDELSFDRFHANRDSIYRVLTTMSGLKSGSGNTLMAVTPGKLAGAVKNQIPEVIYVTRNIKDFRKPYTAQERGFYEDRVYQVDPDFFKMFSFHIVKGNTDNPFANINDIVISGKTAAKYFGKENPIGKRLYTERGNEYTVSAVMENMPHNSHMQMDILQSHFLTEKYWKPGYSWTNYLYETYVMLDKNADPGAVATKIENLLNENFPLAKFHAHATLQPLSDIYLNSASINSSALTGHSIYVNIFSLIAVGILLIACVNFVNISTANSISRSREIGIRKVLGSDKKSLIIQFMAEFAILTIIAAVFALILLQLTLPLFNQFIGKPLALDVTSFLIFSAIVVLTAVAGGSYPAFYLSAFTPDRVLKNKFSDKIKGLSLRSALVVFQFSVSIILIVSIIVINNQLSYIRNKDLGFDKDNVLYIPAKGKLAENFKKVNDQFRRYSNISHVAMKECQPFETVGGSFVTWNEHTDKDLIVRVMHVTPGYFETMDINAASGRTFSRELATDENKFVMNDAAVRFLGIESPVNRVINAWGYEGRIIGIVNDTHFKSLHHKLEPLIFRQLPESRFGELEYTAGSILIRFSGNNIKDVVSRIETVWQEYNPDIPFEYHFLDRTIEQRYRFEQRLSTILTGFGLLAIVISCLGLFALISFASVSRTKEIGLRKVLGASSAKIVLLLSIDFAKWALIANVIAWPLAWFAMRSWLITFAYHVDLIMWPFLFSGLLTLVMALATVSFQAVRAARANPVESLRYE